MIFDILQRANKIKIIHTWQWVYSYINKYNIQDINSQKHDSISQVTISTFTSVTSHFVYNRCNNSMFIYQIFFQIEFF